MSEIESLMSQVQQFGVSVDFWGRVVTVLMALTALLGLLYFLGTVQQSRVSKKLRTAQEALSKAKDAQLVASMAKDKLESDVKIAGVKAESDQKIAAANRRSDEISATSNRQAAELNRQNLATDAKLEEEKTKRLNLAASLLERTFADQSGAIARLTGIPPMEAVFEFPDEREPRKMAEQINFVLTNLHWTTSRRRRDNESTIPDGVTISLGMVGNVEEFLPKGATIDERRKLVPRILGIPKELRDVLRGSGIGAETGPLMRAREDLPPSTVLIRVGPKPNPLVEETLRELGPQPEPTPLSGNIGKMVKVAPGSSAFIKGARTPIPEQKPENKKP